MSCAPVEVFLACRLRDFPVLILAVQGCREHFGASRIIVACPKQDVKAMRFGLRGDAEVIDENRVTPNMDQHAFRSAKIPYFPAAFGWYCQQILKMSFARTTAAQHYLVWDADTIPLTMVPFFDSKGRIFLTTSNEYHEPYFHTYKQLIGENPPHAHSFISQHMLVDSAAMRSLLAEIEMRFQVDDWTVALREVLCQSPYQKNLFSEYETYANYLSARFPEKVATRTLQWSREDNVRTWGVDQNRITRARDSGDVYLAVESKNTICARLLLKAFEQSRFNLIKKMGVLLARELAGFDKSKTHSKSY